jgi:CheY-like chemotaxis protein
VAKLPLSAEIPAEAAGGMIHCAEEPLLVLIADDDDDCRDRLKELLEIFGYRALAARDGLEALATIRQVRPPVAIIDIDMPGYDGYEVARQVRADRSLDATFLIALTG